MSESEYPGDPLQNEQDDAPLSPEPMSATGQTGGDKSAADYPVLDLRVLPEPIDDEEFGDEIPVLSDAIIAGDPDVRGTLPDAITVAPMQAEDTDVGPDGDLNAPVPELDLETESDELSSADLTTLEADAAAGSIYDADDNSRAGGDSLDLRLDNALVDAFIGALEQGVTNHFEQALQQRLAGVAQQLSEEIRGEVRTLVRGYVDTYLPELLAENAENN